MSKPETIADDNRILASITVAEFESMLARLKSPRAEDRLLSIDEAMKILGYDASEKQSFERNKEIAKCRRKIGHKTIRYSSLAIQRFIESKNLTVIRV